MATVLDAAKAALAESYPGLIVRLAPSEVGGESFAAQFSDDGATWIELEMDRNLAQTLPQCLPQWRLQGYLHDARAGDWP